MHCAFVGGIVDRNQIQQIFRGCEHRVPSNPFRMMSMKEKFQHLADSLDGSEMGDAYGQSAYLQHFEGEVASLLGKESAVFMPSGTMAQQCALRIHCEKRRNCNVAFHPTSHLEIAERNAHLHLHGIRRLQFGAPERVRNRMLVCDDFQKLAQKPAAILLEIPYRPLGFSLPPWEELCAISKWARQEGIAMHLDGARLWQAKPFYQREYAEIASLFDSVYVSFYKDLGGWCGAILAGDDDLVAEARVWQRRHGGNLTSQDYNYVSARLGLHRCLPQIESWVEKAKEVASVLSSFPRMRVYPDPPHTNAFRLYLEGDASVMLETHMRLAQETGDFLFFWLDPAPVPGFCTTEIQCMENSLSVDPIRIRRFVQRLLQRT